MFPKKPKKHRFTEQELCGKRLLVIRSGDSARTTERQFKVIPALPETVLRETLNFAGQNDAGIY